MQEGVVVIMRFTGSPFASLGSLLEGLAPMNRDQDGAGRIPPRDRVEDGRGGLVQPPEGESDPDAAGAAASGAGDPPAADHTSAAGGAGLVRAIEEALARQ